MVYVHQPLLCTGVFFFTVEVIFFTVVFDTQQQRERNTHTSFFKITHLRVFLNIYYYIWHRYIHRVFNVDSDIIVFTNLIIVQL